MINQVPIAGSPTLEIISDEDAATLLIDSWSERFAALIYVTLHRRGMRLDHALTVLRQPAVRHA
jgi:hypothetical protein